MIFYHTLFHFIISSHDLSISTSSLLTCIIFILFCIHHYLHTIHHHVSSTFIAITTIFLNTLSRPTIFFCCLFHTVAYDAYIFGAHVFLCLYSFFSMCAGVLHSRPAHSLLSRVSLLYTHLLVFSLHKFWVFVVAKWCFALAH